MNTIHGSALRLDLRFKAATMNDYYASGSHVGFGKMERKGQKLETINDKCLICGKKTLYMVYLFRKTIQLYTLLIGRVTFYNDCYAVYCDSCHTILNEYSYTDKNLSKKYGLTWTGKHKKALEKPHDMEVCFVNAIA